MTKMKHNDGFTLLEILLVVAAIAILAGIVIFALNPSKQLAEARNAERSSDVRSLLDAVYQYSIDHDGELPTGIDSSLRMIGSASSGCDVICGSGGSAMSEFTDDDQADFDAGSYADSQWDGGNGWLDLTATGMSNGTGIYTSEIMDAESSTPWGTLEWVPQRPFGKELPGSGQTETVYTEGNVDMAGNALLLHMNESGGTVFDSSGNGNDGSINGSVTYGGGGIYGSGLEFDGYDSFVSISDNASLDLTSSGSLEVWFYAETIIDFAGLIHKGDQISFADEAYTLQFWNNDRLLLGIVNESTSEILYSSSVISPGVWYHVVGTWDASGMAIYLNGSLDSSTSNTLVVRNSTGGVNIGAQLPVYYNPTYRNFPFDGILDEVAVYNRALTPTEIQDRYIRGVSQLSFQVRSCDDASCSGESFVGPDGTGSTDYSELNSAALALPTFSITNVSDNQYFQYQVTLATRDSLLSPELLSVTVSNSSGGDETTESTCLDLSSDLVSEYLTAIPYDPSVGDLSRTYYAIRTTGTDRIEVISCGAELGEQIIVRR